MGVKYIRKSIALIPACAVVVVGCAIWAWSHATAKSDFITMKVQNALRNGIQVVERDAPRVHVTDGTGFYAPDVNKPETWFALYKVVLTDINQDDSVPMCKLQSPSLNTDFRNINAYVKVKYEVFPGITRTTVVSVSEPMPMFKNPTGDNHY